jgi:glycosyltransferase involved in cell wall biosynthesis
MSQPLVSVITPTCGRPTLSRAIESLKAQTYPNIEHIVVADGRLRDDLRDAMDFPRSRYIQLGRRWSDDVTGPGMIASNVGFYLAHGEYLYVLCDDDILMPTCIERLVEACERTGADFSYSRVAMVYGDAPMTLEGALFLVGEDPPSLGRITNWLFRYQCLIISDYHRREPGGDPKHPEHDWYMVKRWIDGGKRWQFVPETLHIHHVDHG